MFQTFGQSNWCIWALDWGGVLRMDGCEFYLDRIVLEGDGGGEE